MADATHAGDGGAPFALLHGWRGGVFQGKAGCQVHWPRFTRQEWPNIYPELPLPAPARGSNEGLRGAEWMARNEIDNLDGTGYS